MFNSYRHFDPDFDAFEALSEPDRIIYRARKEVFIQRFKWSTELQRLFDNCLLHMSSSVPGKIAYFPTVETLRQNRVTRTSPEMFLERYLMHAPDRLRAAFAIEVLGKTLPGIKFIENTDPDGWVRIYANGPNSCMKGSNIVRCYAHPKNNLALAYNEREDGTIQNRCIVNRRNMNYVRIFGVEGPEFAAALRKLGYTCEPVDALNGETIYTLSTTCRDCEADIFAGPYLDSGDQYISDVRPSDLESYSEGILATDGEDLIHAGDQHEGFNCCE